MGRTMKTADDIVTQIDEAIAEAEAELARLKAMKASAKQAVKDVRRPGRPRGAKNKTKEEPQPEEPREKRACPAYSGSPISPTECQRYQEKKPQRCAEGCEFAKR